MNKEAIALLFQMVLSLAVVLALAFVLLRFVLPKVTGITTARNEDIELLSVRHLDRQTKVALLRAEGKRFLVAFGLNGVALLHSAPEDPAASEEEGEA